jgi:hypothetical protein
MSTYVTDHFGSLPEEIIKSPQHWRLRAEEMRTLSDDAMDPDVRVMMRRIATDYDRLAELAEKHNGAGLRPSFSMESPGPQLA